MFFLQMGVVAPLIMFMSKLAFWECHVGALLTAHLSGRQWLCDPGSSYGCCTPDSEFMPCDGASPASAVPSRAPTPSSKSQSFKNVTVSATDPRITYTPQWDLGSSTCDASQQSKKTVTTNQSLSFNTQGFSGKSIYYLD